MLAETTVNTMPVLLACKPLETLPEPGDEDAFDQNFALELPPVRPTGTLRVRLVYSGRSKSEVMPLLRDHVKRDRDFC